MLSRGMGRGSKRKMSRLEVLVRRSFAWYVVMKGLVTKTYRKGSGDRIRFSAP